MAETGSPMPRRRHSFREALSSNRPLVTPAAYDALSARLIEEAGFQAVGISGSALVGARYGLPDLGLVGLADMAAGARDILEATNLPCSTDADDGYGDIKSVVRTIRTYERMGIGSLALEDQAGSRKRPGENADDVVDAEEMEAKLRAAAAAREGDEMLITARTDAYRVHGLDEALRRGERYLKAGADGLLISAVRKPEDLERVGRAFKGAYLQTVLADVSGAAGPTVAELGAMGFARITIPSLLVLAATQAMAEALGQLSVFVGGAGPRPRIADPAGAAAAFQKAVRLPQWTALEKGQP